MLIFNSGVNYHNNSVVLSKKEKIDLTGQVSERNGVVDNEVKIMTYNIGDSGWDPTWKDVVKEENPDILVCIETGDWDNNDNEELESYTSHFNDHFYREDPYESRCVQGVDYSSGGSAVLSRFPITYFEQVSVVKLDDGSSYDMMHSFMHCAVEINNMEIHLLGVHLKAMSGYWNEWQREWEMEGIINFMDGLGDVPIMLLGDLNCYSPEDEDMPEPEEGLGYGPMTMIVQPGDSYYGQYSSEVHYFTDVYRYLNPDNYGFTYGHKNPDFISRIDFIIINSVLEDRLISSTAGDTPSADTGSDHYSVDVIMDMLDLIDPVLDLSLFDLTPIKADHGENLTFRIGIANSTGDRPQNINVHLEYWFDSGPHVNLSLNGTRSYSRTVLIPKDRDKLYYRFSINSQGENWVNTDMRSIELGLEAEDNNTDENNIGNPDQEIGRGLILRIGIISSLMCLVIVIALVKYLKGSRS